MKISSALLITFLVSAVLVAADGDKQGADEVIIVGKKPPAGAVIFKPEATPTIEADKADSKETKPAKDSKDSKETKPAAVKETGKQQPTNKKNAQDETSKEDPGVPTRLFRPRYRNSGESATLNVALISLSVFIGILLL